MNKNTISQKIMGEEDIYMDLFRDEVFTLENDPTKDGLLYNNKERHWKERSLKYKDFDNSKFRLYYGYYRG